MVSPPTEFSNQTLSRLNEHIKFADRKASVLLTGHLGFLGLFVNFLNEHWAGSGIWFKSLAAITIGAILLAGVFAGWVIYPQTEPSGEALLFWENINRYSFDSYETQIEELDEDAVLDELIEENHLLAEVASNKYRRLKFSLVATAGAVSFSILSIIPIFCFG